MIKIKISLGRVENMLRATLIREAVAVLENIELGGVEADRLSAGFVAFEKPAISAKMY